MRVYNSIILSGLLVAGFASNLKSFEYRSAQKLQEFNIQQHLVADAEDATSSSPKPHRGSGRLSEDPKNTEKLKDVDKKGSGTEPSRGSGRLNAQANTNNDLLAQQLFAKKDDDKGSGTEPSRGSGRLNEANLINA